MAGMSRRKNIHSPGVSNRRLPTDAKDASGLTPDEIKNLVQALQIHEVELEKRVAERTAEVLRERQRLYNVLETLPVMICLVTLDHQVAFANRAFREQHGGEVRGRHCYEYTAQRIEPCDSCEAFDTLKTGQPHRWEKAAPDGRSVFDVYSFRLTEADGSLFILEMGIDVTQRKNTEQELTKANEQLKQFGHRITQVQEEERKRIAYELHDDTAQYLSILKMQLGALVQSGNIQSPELLEKLRYLEKDADRAFNDVRRYSHELRPSVLEHMGLGASMEQIAEDINKLSSLEVEVRVQGREPKLDEEVKLGFFRIAQEALNNIRKHAKAEKAVIEMKYQKKQMSMRVIDNGVGFDTQQATTRAGKKGSLGLMSMQERADLIGASLEIESRRGGGTTVKVELEL
jgi:PAS domain S-box-containing protein